VCLLVYYFYFDNKFHTVVEGRIYRSARLSDDNLEKTIKEKGIKTIINLAGRRDDKDWYKREKEIAAKNNVLLHDVSLSPHDLPEIYEITSILNMLLYGEKPFLIHCKEGVDRTGLVSAIALIIEKDPPLSLIKKQFSFRYGVFPFIRSVGPYFFKNYEQWLKKNKKNHSKSNFLYWVANDYVDYNGNVKSWIDSVNDEPYTNKKVIVRNDKEELSIKGWSFDFRTKAASDGLLYVVIDNQISQRAITKFNMPGVARWFKLGEMYYKNFVVGWEAKFRRDNLSDGCHNISLRLVKNNSAIWITTVQSEYEFCF
jgi:protein tyrosine/serine phosphatase